MSCRLTGNARIALPAKGTQGRQIKKTTAPFRENGMAKIDQFLEMRKLYCFQQVASSRSFRHAARQLGITQPALTRHVQDLEEKLGVILVHRHTSGNKLTEAGQSLAQKVDEVLSVGASLKADLMNLQSTMVGTVTVAVSMLFNDDAKSALSAPTLAK